MSAFPLMPLLPPFVGAGLWELFATTTGSTYPTGLQEGDVAVFLSALAVQQTDSGYTYPPTPLTFPTGATEIASLYASGNGYYSSGDYYWTNSVGAAVSWRTVGAAQSGAALGGGGASRTLIYRPTVIGSPSVAVVGSTGTGTSYSATAAFGSEPNSPVLACFVSLAIADVNTRNPTSVSLPTHSFDAAAPEETYGLPTTGNLWCRVRFSVKKQATKADIAVACTAISGSLSRLHETFAIRK
jgi:hypothetical protein